MIERNRSTDKNDINKLEDKIKALETQINKTKAQNTSNLEQSMMKADELALLDDCACGSSIDLNEEEELLRQ